MKKRFIEWISVQRAKNPRRIVLTVIMFFNILFFFLSAIIISALSLDGTEQMGFIEAAFCTLTMILDPGCIQFVVADIGQAGVVITLFCLFVVVVGMISFTGAIIGYVTNYIAHFIDTVNAGRINLHISNHYVILNWNSRASEIVNDMLYCDEKSKVVVLVSSGKEEITKEIDESLSDTISRENLAIAKKYAHLPFFARQIAIRKNRFKKNVTVLVREGDVFSFKQLNDISIKSAKSIIILEKDTKDAPYKIENPDFTDNNGRGNAQTIKTLMQVSDIISAEDAVDNQKIIVEITDRWTWEIVREIKKIKQVDGKCNIIPVRVNEVLGQILSQFCLMPELNTVYSELFSNKGAEFYTKEQPYEDEVEFVQKYFDEHNHAIPVTIMQNGSKWFSYYMANNDKDVERKTVVVQNDFSVSLNKQFKMERKNIIILGHNSKCKFLMAGFKGFCEEWCGEDKDTLRIIVLDDKKSLEKMNYYREYPFVVETVEADIYDRDIICSTINRFVSENKEDTSVLILSDDTTPSENVDANALANLVYVRDIINQKVKENPDFDTESIDVIVEIIDPKHHDVVNSYSVNNVVISNRYISKMITQISEVEALFDFYADILTYDTEDSLQNNSKEIYIKKAEHYFDNIPPVTTADKLVRAIFDASINDTVDGNPNPTIMLGYVKPGGNIVIFGGDLTQISVELNPDDKLILFSSH